MNGIIHQCSHPNDDHQEALPQEQIFNAIFNYVDHIFQVIAPKKVFYMAVDGAFFSRIPLIELPLTFFFLLLLFFKYRVLNNCKVWLQEQR